MGAEAEDRNRFSVEVLRSFDKEVLVQYVATYLAPHIRIADLQAFARFHRTQDLMRELQAACRAAHAVEPVGRNARRERNRRQAEIERLRAELFDLTGVEPEVDRAERRHE